MEPASPDSTGMPQDPSLLRAASSEADEVIAFRSRLHEAEERRARVESPATGRRNRACGGDGPDGEPMPPEA